MNREEVLLANEAFYLAFAEKDLKAMDRLWADRPNVLCVHPGWPALTNRREVMASWMRILGNPDQPAPAMHVTGVLDLGDAMLVVCYERVAEAVMVASNVFAPEPAGPRLVAHHAGPCGSPPDLPAFEVPSFNA